MAQRIRRTYNQKEFETTIDDYITQGFKVKSRGENTARLVKPSSQSAIVHVALFLFTAGVGNIIYYLYKHNKYEDDVLVKLAENQ